MKNKITRNDFIQISLNLLAFFVLFSAPTGKGSFWGFTTFFILASLILLEINLQRDKTAIWVWITKAITYLMFVIKFSSNIGPFHWEYVFMILISVLTLYISRNIIQKRALAMIGTNTAYVIGGIMYIIAIFKKPEDFGFHHIVFWLINCISYGILIYQILKEKRDRVNLIIPVYAFIFCIVYMIILYFT